MCSEKMCRLLWGAEVKESEVMKSVFNLSVALVVASCSFGVAASDGVINISGRIVNAACKVDVNSANVNVVLPTVSVDAMGATAGNIAGKRPFDINLKDCVSATSEAQLIRVAFYGTPDEVDPTVLKNGGDAGGVGVVLLRDDGSSKIDINGGPNKAPSITLPSPAEGKKDLTLTFNAAYIASLSGGPVTAGTVVAQATWEIEYL